MADARGFVYPLQPLVLKAEWEASDALADLAGACVRLEAAAASAQAIGARVVQVQALARGSAHGGSIDPFARQQLTQVLQRLDELARDAERQRRSCEQEHKDALRVLGQRRHYADGLGRDRDEALHAFRRGQDNNQRKDADDLWLQRTIWKEKP